MHTLRGVARRLFLAIGVLTVMVNPAPSQTGVNVTTWHNDNYRTGQNTSEATLTLSNVAKNTFGLLCSITLLPQIGYMGNNYNQVYAQPLVLWNSTNGNMTVYVATMNDYVYAYTIPMSLSTSTCSSVSVVTRNLLDLYPDEEPAMCANVGSTMCLTIAPVVGVLGTPVIDTNTNTLYLVAESQTTSTPFSYHHRVHALDAATLVEKYGGPASIPSTIINQAQFVSQSELQRPGLLLAYNPSSPSYPTLYIAFSMMDGTKPEPSGWIFAYDAQNLLGQPLFPKVYATTPGKNLQAYPGGGIWMAGAGLTLGTDENGTSSLYFSTANGFFDLNGQGGTDAADSLVKLSLDLQTTKDYFTASDQAWRQCFDIDYGSGGPILLPDSTFSSHSYAVMADKENFLWTVDRLNLGHYAGTPTCTNLNCDYANKKCVVQGVQCMRCATPNPNLPEQPIAFGPFPDINNGPFDRSAPAFWSGSAITGDKGELYLGGNQDQLKRFPVSMTCPVGQTGPICNFVVQTNVPAAPPAGPGLGYSATPSISSNYQNGQYTNGIMWAIKTQGSPGVDANAILYAFNAIDLTELYDSTQCTQSGTLVDQPGPGEKFSVPTIANGYVFIGTQTDFDIYGPLQRTCGN